MESNTNFKNPFKPTVAEMERINTRLSFYKEKVAETEALEKRAAAASGAYEKIKAAYAHLTAEEKNASEGMYIFIHGGMVDMVRQQPSPTDVGEGKKFLNMMARVEAIALQLQNLP